MHSNRWTVAGLVFALVCWTAVTAPLHRGLVGEIPDDGLLFVAAQSLRDGHGYALPSWPGPPIRPRYSIGFPAMLAVAMKLSPASPSLAHDEAACRAVVDAGFWTFVLGTFVLLRRARVPRVAAALGALGAMFNPVTLQFGVAIMSDLPYAAMAAIMLARWSGRRPGGGRPVPSAFVDGLIVGFAYTVRGNGIALVLGALVAATLGRQRLRAIPACLLGVALVVVPLTIETRLATGSRVSGGYGQELAAGWYSASAGLATLAMNVRGTTIGLADLVAPVGWLNKAARFPLLLWGSRIVVDLLIAVGAVRLARRGGRRALPGLAFAMTTLGIFLVWPWEADSRFLLGLLPLAWMAFYSGLLAIAGGLGLGPRGVRLVAIAGLAGALAVNVASWAGSARSAFRNGGDYSIAANPTLARATDELLAYIRDQLEPDAVIAAHNPETIYLYTGKKVVKLVQEQDQILGRYGRREGSDSLLSLMDATPGLPFYLWTRGVDDLGRRGGPQDHDLNQLAAYSRDPDLSLRIAHRTSDGVLQLVAVARKTAGAPAPAGPPRVGP